MYHFFYFIHFFNFEIKGIRLIILSNMETKYEATMKNRIEEFKNWLDEKTIELDRKAKTALLYPKLINGFIIHIQMKAFETLGFIEPTNTSNYRNYFKQVFNWLQNNWISQDLVDKFELNFLFSKEKTDGILVDYIFTKINDCTDKNLIQEAIEFQKEGKKLILRKLYKILCYDVNE